MRRTAGLTRRTALGVGAAVLSGAWIREAKAANGTLTVALSDNPITCDPINMASHDTMIVSQTIWENLLEFDVDGVLKPQLAKALPEISADKLTYTFELRDDVLFQNGQLITMAFVPANSTVPKPPSTVITNLITADQAGPTTPTTAPTITPATNPTPTSTTAPSSTSTTAPSSTSTTKPGGTKA